MTKTRITSALLTALGVFGFLSIWELTARMESLRSPLLPPPSAVALEVRNCWKEGTLLDDTFASLRRVSVGFVCGATLGTAVGGLYLLWPVRALLAGVLGIIRPIPPLAWIGLSLLWFGFGDPPAHFLVALGAFFSDVERNIPRLFSRGSCLSKSDQALGLQRHLLFTRVLLPQALPSILSSMRVGMGVAWMIVVTAELVGAQSGLGYMIQISRAQLQVERVIVGMLVIGVIGAMLNLAMIVIERTALPWKRRGRELSSE